MSDGHLLSARAGSAEPMTPLDSLTSALVDANDQILALYDLATITTNSLEEDESVERILAQGKKLLHADELKLLTDDETRSAPDSNVGGVTAVVSVEHSSGDKATLVARRQAKPFGTADKKLLNAVAHMALSAVHTARLHTEALEQAVVARDHAMASELAQRSLPQWRPSLPGTKLFARSDPARTAGGDLFSFAASDDQLDFVVGDVSGKGLPAAMMMSNVIMASNNAFQRHRDDGPATILKAIDSWTYDTLSESALFVTIVVGRYNRSTQTLSLANAGHSPVVFVHHGSAQSLPASCPPVGVLPGIEPTETVISVEPGDRLAICSDGFTEQENVAGEMLGEERLDEWLTDQQLPTVEFGEEMFSQLESFAGRASQTDDRTLFVLDFPGTP